MAQVVDSQQWFDGWIKGERKGGEILWRFDVAWVMGNDIWTRIVAAHVDRKGSHQRWLVDSALEKKKRGIKDASRGSNLSGQDDIN